MFKNNKQLGFFDLFVFIYDHIINQIWGKGVKLYMHMKGVSYEEQEKGFCYHGCFISDIL